MPAQLADSAPVKKRRSFFSSSIPLPKLPLIDTSLPAAPPPRHQVLAALSAPEDGPGPSTRPKRDASAKVVDEKPAVPVVKAPTSSTVEPRQTRRAARPSQPPAASISTTVASRSLRPKSSRHSLPIIKHEASTTARTTSPESTTPFFTTPSFTLASRRLPSTAARPGAKHTSETLLFAPPKAKGRAPSKDVKAQNINERLSQLMMQSMRATIGGRDEGSERVPVWRDNHTPIRRTTTILPAPALTARQKAKARARGETKAEASAKVIVGEEEEPTVKEDESGVQLEPTTSTPPKGKTKLKDTTGTGKKYMTSGFYCQDANAKSPFKLVNQVLGVTSSKAASSSKRQLPSRTSSRAAAGPKPSFPPLPYDHGYDHFFGREHDFVLPYNIHKEAMSGVLNDKKKPAPYQKIRANTFPERSRIPTERAVCKCHPDSGCSENCINRIMNYLCGKECPCGDACTNRSLAKRTPAETKVRYTGSRGFGLFATKDIAEGQFVIDYRGEVIYLQTFLERLDTDYAGVRNFYALDYDQGEVVDSGMRGNDARFINHGCDPNLEVRRYQTLGDGLEEYEIGMWAVRDIKEGEELFYNYNFDWFGEADDSVRSQCRCGATNCIGRLGRKAGEKAAARDVAADVESRKAADAARQVAKSRPSSRTQAKAAPKAQGQITAAVDRAKNTIATRTTRVSARASVVSSNDTTDLVDAELGIGAAAEDQVDLDDDDADDRYVKDDSETIDVRADSPAMVEASPTAQSTSHRDQHAIDEASLDTFRDAGDNDLPEQIASAQPGQYSERRTSSSMSVVAGPLPPGARAITGWSPADEPAVDSHGRSRTSSTQQAATRGSGPADAEDSSLVRARATDTAMDNTEAVRAVVAPAEQSPPSASSSPRNSSSSSNSKKAAIARRNGAPRGWAYEELSDETPSKRKLDMILDESLPRSARRTRGMPPKDNAAH